MGHFASYYKSKLSVLPFVPTDIAGCQLWLKADAGIIKDGSNYVSQWDDQSGNNNHAVQATAINQPLFVNSAYNGLPSIRFNGMSNFMSGIVDAPINEQLSVFFVAKQYDNTLNNGALLLNMSSVSDDYINTGEIVVMANSSTSQIFFRNISGATNNYSSSFINSMSAFCLKIDSSAPYAIYTHYVNGILGSTVYSGNYAFLYDRYILGCRYVSGLYSYFLNIEFSEVLIYNSALSDTNRQLVENYINTKYAIW